MKEISIADATLFARLFAGKQDAYGSFQISSQNKGVKVQGKATTIQGAVTPDLYLKHLKGDAGLGIIPIKSNNKCSFASIDVDRYTQEVHQRILTIINNFNMPLRLFTSKSGGIHAYLFFKEEVTAKFARQSMMRFRDLLGLPDKTEIFPKQNKLDEKDSGSWINLPYFNAGEECKRNLLDNDGKSIYDLTLALSQCEMAQISEEDLKTFFESIPLQDAPPCLQQLYVTSNTEARNNYLFSLSIYFKAKYGDKQAEEELFKANKRLANPLPISELTTSIISSMKKKDYSYKCEDTPLCTLCNPEECAKRKFGLGGKEVSKLSFGEFRQIMSDPPSYEWDVNGQKLVLNTEDDIINQNCFRKQCVRKLGILPEKVSDIRWGTMVNRALRNRVIIEVDPDVDVSPGALVRSYIISYIAQRSQMGFASKRAVLQGFVFFDSDLDMYVFDPQKLAVWLMTQKKLKPEWVASEFLDKIRALGGKVIDYDIDGEQKVKCYGVPSRSIISASKQAATTLQKNNFLEQLAGVNTDF